MNTSSARSFEIIILVGFPTVQVNVDYSSFDLTIYAPIMDSPIWGVMFFIDAITIAVWVPILMAIAIRELANSSTVRVFISSMTIGILVAIFYYFTRPALFGGM